jgi:hypothetical protein
MIRFCTVWLWIVLAAHAAELRNERYTLDADAAGGISVAGKRLTGDFVVMWSEEDPHLVRNASHPNYAVAPRVAVRWGLDKKTDTTRPFSVGQSVVMKPAKARIDGDHVQWNYPERQEFTFTAELRLPAGQSDPILNFTITPKRAAFFSVACTGAPDAALKDTLALPQECEARGHKQFDYVMSEADLHLPRAQVTTKQDSVALVADPKECRFRLPKIADSRFGLMLSSEAGRLKPVLIAPLLGGMESKMEPGVPWSFALRCVIQAGDWKDVYAHIARDIHGFRDMRDNSGPGSINGTLERVVDFLADRRGGNHAMWDTQQKYFDYFTDKTGVFKPFSPLCGLSVGIVTDDEEFFRTRGMPAAEFALSRKTNVFAPYDASDNKQANSAVRSVGSPFIGREQLFCLDALFQHRNPVLREMAKDAKPSGKASVSGEEGFFDLLERADATHDAQDIAAAREAAYHQAARLNLYPVPPDESVIVDRGGVAPVHAHSFGRHKNQWGYPAPQPVPAPEQRVPAWRISRLGLPGIAYPIEYWMSAHGAIMRTAALAQDDFLRDIARSGMVGRFGNFPGDNRSQDSLVQELPDAVEAPPWRWNFATVNAGHAWDFSAALLDFLVSDAFQRSGGAIDFPALSAVGSQFRVRIYGGTAGRFFGDQNVRLWLPRGLVKCDNKQIDWLAGYGNGQFYLALWNQSPRTETANITLDRELVQCGQGARCWTDNKPAGEARMDSPIRFAPKGIVAFAIPATVKPRLQSKLYDSIAPLPDESHAHIGDVHAMLLRPGRGLTSAFVYSEALPENLIGARLRWRQGDGEWHELYDDIFPYEFSPELKDDGGDFSCVFEIEDANQTVRQSALIVLPLGGKAPDELPPRKPFPAVAKPAHVRLTEFSEDFVSYLQSAANGSDFGLREDGRFHPYSTPLGRRIAWRQPVWDKALFARGCTREEAAVELRASLSRTLADLKAMLSKRGADFDKLDPRQQETLLDLACSETVGGLRESFVAAVLARDWPRLVSEHLYIRYQGHAPDHARNKAFAKRWNVE